MLIGILSDSHDRIDALAAGVRLLSGRGAEFYIHCGDVCAPHLLDCLAGLPSAFVFGNNDWDHAGLQRYATTLGIQCLGDSGELSLGGKQLVVLHGDNNSLMRQLLTDQKHDYLLYGHTHTRNDQHIGLVRTINPGALHRANPRTVALLDTDADRVEFIEVPATVSGTKRAGD